MRYMTIIIFIEVVWFFVWLSHSISSLSFMLYAIVAIVIFIVGIFILDRWLIWQERMKQEKLPASIKAQREASRRETEYHHPFDKPRRRPGDSNGLYAARIEKWYKRIAQTGEYRGRGDVFDEILMFRNPQRRKSTGGCKICGGSSSRYTSDGGLIQHSLCEACVKQINAKLAIGQAGDNVADYEERTKLERCMAIAYDLNDGIISKECAREDMKATEGLCLDNIQTAHKSEADEQHKVIEYQNAEKAERHTIDQTVQRLLQ